MDPALEAHEEYGRRIVEFIWGKLDKACAKCGHKNGQEMAYCMSCGHLDDRYEPPTIKESRRNPVGHYFQAVFANAVYCGRCGVKIRRTKRIKDALEFTQAWRRAHGGK